MVALKVTELQDTVLPATLNLIAPELLPLTDTG